MKQLSFALLLFSSALIFFPSCNESTIAGSDLIQGDLANISATDTFSMRAFTFENDSVEVYSPITADQNDYMLCGILQDATFGTYSASMYLQMRPSETSRAATFKKLATARVDSVVLVMTYDTIGLYGDTNQLFSLDVFRVVEDMDNIKRYKSTQQFMVNPVAIGQKHNFLPRPRKKTYINGTDTVKITTTGIRIPINNAIGQELLHYDSLKYANDENFIQAFKGIQIRASTPSKAMLSFYPRYTDFKVYYTVNDTTHAVWNHVVDPLSTKVNTFEHNFSGTPIQPIFNNTTTGESSLYLQGMAGATAKISFPNLQEINNSIINKAEIEFIAQENSNNNINREPDRILAYILNSENKLELVDEAKASLYGGASGIFGGTRTSVTIDGVAKYKYSMNLTSVFQKIALGTARENAIYLRVASRVASLSSTEDLRNHFSAARVVIHGTKHPQYPIKLKVAYTKID